jgi:hypothetical protein
MRRLCAIVTILLPLAVMAAQADGNSFSVPDPQARYTGIGVQATPDRFLDSIPSFQKSPGTPMVVAHGAADSPGKDVKGPENGAGSDLDLRYVDWDKVKPGAKGKHGSVKNGDNGDKDENVEGEEDEKKGDDEKEKNEGGGGWDRLWDTPKLG